MKTIGMVLLVLFLAPVNGFAAPSGRAGDVVRVRGRVEVSGPSRKLAARPRLALFEADQVTTAAAARVKMLFRDDSVLTLGPESLLVVRQYLYSPEERRADSIYELLDGGLRSVVGNASFRVETPTAYAAARGTIFVVWYDPDRRITGVAVLEGEVEVGGSDSDVNAVVVLSEGQMTLVPAGRSPEPPTGFDVIGPDSYDLSGYILDFGVDSLPLAWPYSPVGAVDFSGLDLVRALVLPPFVQPPSASDQGTAVGMTLNFP